MPDHTQTPNVGADPINPAYYAGTACAEIIEHLPANLAFAAKYAWRLGEKDTVSQEAAKAIWYLRRELERVGGAPLPVYTPTLARGFQDYASDRITAAAKAGKLDLRRSEIVGECVAYAIDHEQRHLGRAIGLFEYYLA